MLINCFEGKFDQGKAHKVSFTARAIAEDSHHCKSLISCKQGFNIQRNLIQDLLNKAVQL